MKILITGAGGEAARTIHGALSGVPAEIWLGGVDPTWPELGAVPEHRRVELLDAGDPQFISSLLALCTREGIDVVIASLNSEFAPLAARRTDFEAMGTRVLVPSAESQTNCKDRDRFDALMSGLPRAAARTGTDYAVHVLCNSDYRAVAAVPRQRFRVRGGIAEAANTLPDIDLIELATEAAQRVQAVGIVDVRIRRDPSGAAGVHSLGLGFPDTIDLTVAAGVNMPALALQQLLGLPLATRYEFSAYAMPNRLAASLPAKRVSYLRARRRKLRSNVDTREVTGTG